jgi:alcohol dehydrogenase class IV
MYSIKLGCEKMYYGENAVNGLANLEGTRKKAFIVMSGDILEKLGSLKLVTTVLEEAGFEWMTYTDVEPEPSFNTIMKGVGFMTEFNPDWIIGFGGGSAMDAAKAMWVFYENPDCKELDDVMPPKIIKNLKVKARIACIPTSAGTGSEATRAALIKDTVKKRKYSIRDMNGRMVPDVAILDPVFTASMPKSLIAASGMDAITHAIESFVTPNANPFSDAMAMASFINGYNNIVMAYEEADNTEAKSRMLAASCMGGIAFSNGGLGIVHSIAHTFGAEYGVPHGLANAIVLPYGLEYNGKNTEVLNKYKELARMVGETSLLEGIRKINSKINIPYCMKEVVKEEEDVLNKMDELVEKAMSDICTSFTPVKPTKEELKELILKVYYGN